jgi:hypothetical protein
MFWAGREYKYVVVPGREHLRASPESITPAGEYGFRACASKSTVADLDDDSAELG